MIWIVSKKMSDITLGLRTKRTVFLFPTILFKMGFIFSSSHSSKSSYRFWGGFAWSSFSNGNAMNEEELLIESNVLFSLFTENTGTGNLTSVTESVTAQFFTLPSSVPWPLDNMRNGWMEFGNTRQRKILLFREPLQYRSQRDLALTLKLTIARRLKDVPNLSKSSFVELSRSQFDYSFRF